MRLSLPALRLPTPKPEPAEAPAPAPSVQQTHIRAAAVSSGVLVLKDGRCRAVLEVAGLPLASLPAQKQETALAGLLRLFSGLSHPLQLVTRSEVVGLEAHAAEVEAATAGLTGPVRELAAEYGAFLRSLALEQPMLRRRCLVVVPADAGLTWADARRQLVTRCGDLLRGFALVGMPGQRLNSGELHALLASVWRPGAQPAPWDADDGPRPDLPAVLADTGNLSAALEALAPTAAPSKAMRLAAALPWWAAWARPGLVRLDRRLRRPSAEDATAAVDLWAAADTLADRIAPAAAGETAWSFRLQDGDREATRTLRVTSWPRVTTLGWLAPLAAFPDTVDLSLHLAPADVKESLSGINRRLWVVNAARQSNAQKGRPDEPDLETAASDLTRMQSAIAVSGERVWDAALYVHLRARGDHAERALGSGREGLQNQAETALARTLAESHPLLYQQAQGFRAAEPVGADPVATVRRLDTRTVARALPFVVGTESGRGVLLGRDRLAHGPVLWDAFDAAAFNSNLAVMAPSGSGKSYALKLLASRHRYLGADVLVIDPEGEFIALCRAHGGEVVRFGTSGGSRINPLDVPPADTDDRGTPVDPVRERAAAVSALVETMLTRGVGSLPGIGRAAVEGAVLTAYTRAGIVPDQEETWGLTPPLLRDVRDALAERNPQLASDLEPFVDGLYSAAFDGPTNVELDRSFVVFDVSKVDDRLRPVVIAAVTAHVWREARRVKRPRLLVVDEAASVLQTVEGARFLGEVAKRARKHYLGLCVAVQKLSHLDDSPAGRDVLQNAASKLILSHREADTREVEKVVSVFDLSEGEKIDLLAADKGEGLLFSRGGRRPVRVLASRGEHELMTTDPREAAAAAKGV